MLINTFQFTEVRRPPIIAVKGFGGNSAILYLDNMGNIATSSYNTGMTTPPSFIQDASSDEYINGNGASNTKRTTYVPSSKNYASASWLTFTAQTGSAGFDYVNNKIYTYRTSGSSVSFVNTTYSQTEKTGSGTGGTLQTPSNTVGAPRLLTQTSNFYRGNIIMGHVSQSGVVGGGRLTYFLPASNELICVTASFGLPILNNPIARTSSPCFNHRNNKMMYAVITTGSTLYAISRDDIDSPDPANTASANVPNYSLGYYTSSIQNINITNTVYLPYLNEMWLVNLSHTKIHKYKLGIGGDVSSGVPVGQTGWTTMLVSGSMTGTTNVTHIATMGGIEKWM